MSKGDTYDVDERPFCPFLTIASGKARPCAKEKCEMWCEQFDYRYSSCALTTIARNTSTMSIIMKKAQSDSWRP